MKPDPGNGATDGAIPKATGMPLAAYALLAAIYWLALWKLGFPPPHTDDLFFTGAAMNLSAGGTFSNPYLHNLSPPFTPDTFFLQPPIHGHVLAGWLSLFGISTASLLGFQALVGWLFSTAVGYGFWRLRKPVAGWVLVVLAYTGFAATQGLRQDTLAVAMVATGFAILLSDTPMRWFCGMVFLGLAPATSPTMAGWVIPGGMALIFLHWQRGKTDGGWKPEGIRLRLTAVAAAVVTVTLLFLGAIDFRWNAFWHDFLLHASYRRVPVTQAIPDYAGWLFRQWREFTDLPVLLSLGVLTMVAWKQKRFHKARRWWLLLPVVTLLLNILLYSSTFWHIAFVAFVFLILGIVTTARCRRECATCLAAAALLLLLNQSVNLVKLTAQRPADPAQIEAIREHITRLPDDTRFAVDFVAARHVFDFRLPPGSRAWDFYRFFPQPELKSVKELEPGWVWIVGRHNLSVHIADSGVGFETVKILGRDFRSIPVRPYEVQLLSP